MANEWKPITGLDELIPPKEAPQPEKGQKAAKGAHEAAPGTPRCTLCGSLISREFFRVNGRLACPGCAATAQTGKPIASQESFTQGLVFGIGAAAAGLVLYAGFTIVTHLYLGYVALAVGWGVGKAIMKGSNGVGGRHYQIAAVVLTYAAISLAEIPILIASGAPASDFHWESELGRLALWGIASPFLELAWGIQGIIGLVILFVGLRVAWRITAARRLSVDGPHTANL